MKKCVILGSAPEKNMEFLRSCTEGAFLICADGGLDTALKAGIEPSLIVGDFDSSELNPPENVETIRLPSHKDDTDMMFAIKEGFRRGYREFLLLGALGGERFDHSIANLLALRYITANGGSGKIVGAGCEIRLSSGETVVLEGVFGRIISVFPFGTPACTVSYHGLEYPLDHHALRSDEPTGVSNCAIEDTVKIEVHNGTALIVLLDP